MSRANAAACYRELGAGLKKRREAAGVTAIQVADYTDWDRTKVFRIEAGQVDIDTVDVILYLGGCGIYRVDATKELELCRRAQQNPGYWLSPHGDWLEGALSSLIYHESTADRTISYEPFNVSGLLQTPAYAREMIARGAARMSRDVDEAVDIRMLRQNILHSPNPNLFVFFVHERALRTEVGSAAIMHEQLLHIVLMAALGHVTLRVIPETAAEQARYGGPFQLFEYRSHRPLLYLDGFLTGMFVENHDLVGDHYCNVLPDLRDLALHEGESREFVANLADEYDRGSAPDADMEEEQPQRERR